MPGARFNEMVFGHFKVSLSLEFLTYSLMGVFQKILAIFSDKSYHIVILTRFFIHLDGQIGFFHSQVKFFCVFKAALELLFLSLFYIKIDDFIIGEIVLRDLKSQIPLVCQNIHLKCFYGHPGLHEVLFGQVLLSYLRIVLGNLSEKRPGYFRGLPLQQLNSLTPLPGWNRGFHCFLKSPCFDVVVNCIFRLLLANEPVPPSFFERND